MYNNYLFKVGLFLTTFLMAACSDKDDVTITSTKTESVTFTVTASQWDDAILTRAGNHSESMSACHTSVSPISDNVSASSSCTQLGNINMEEAHPMTRASRPLDTGSYTLIAYKQEGGNETEVMRLDVTWDGEKFVTSDGKVARMLLLAGDYDFLCYNDRLKLENGKLMPISESDVNYRDALVGRAQATIRNGESRTDVRLHLQHPYARFVVSIVGTALDLQNKETDYSSSDQPVILNYANTAGYEATLNTGSSVGNKTLFFGKIKDINESLTSWLPKYQQSVAADTIYVPAGTKASELKLTFGEADKSTGKNMVYGLPMSGTTHQLGDAGTVLAANGTYLFRIFLSYNFTYLFTDGTTGKLADYWTEKVPVAIVVSKALREAVALKDANGGAKVLWTTDLKNTAHNTSTYDYARMYDAGNGYGETWSAQYSTDGRRKAENDAYPAFRMAAQYNPQVEGWVSNTSDDMTDKKYRWFLPSFGEMKMLYLNLGRGKFFRFDAPEDKRGNFDINGSYDWRGTLVDIGMTQAGGERLGESYWVSTEGLFYGDHVSGTVSFAHYGLFHGRQNASAFSVSTRYVFSNGDRFKVRPFVYY